MQLRASLLVRQKFAYLSFTFNVAKVLVFNTDFPDHHGSISIVSNHIPSRDLARDRPPLRFVCQRITNSMAANGRNPAPTEAEITNSMPANGRTPAPTEAEMRAYEAYMDRQTSLYLASLAHLAAENAIVKARHGDDKHSLVIGSDGLRRVPRDVQVSVNWVQR